MMQLPTYLWRGLRAIGYALLALASMVLWGIVILGAYFIAIYISVKMAPNRFAGIFPPTVINDMTVPYAALIVLLLVFGYLTHEWMHLIPLRWADVDYEVEFNPGDRPLWWNLTIGRAFEFNTETPPKLAIVSLLAPVVLTPIGWLLWTWLLISDFVSLVLILTIGTWIVVFLPSLSDCWEAIKQLGHLRR